MNTTSFLQNHQHSCQSSMRPSTSCSSQSLSFRSSVSNVVAFRPQQQAVQRGCRQQKVECAISRATKEKRVAELEEALRNSSVAFGVRYNKVSVKNLEAFRRSLPESAKMIVAKNTLVSLAADRVEGWSELKQGIKLENAWVFAPEDAISTSIKAFLDFEKKLLEPIPKADRAKTKLTDVSGGAMGGNYLTPEQVRKLEKLPTKKELITAIAVMVKKVPTKVAVAIKQVPTKLAYGIKALADGDDNKDLIVGDVFPKAPSA
ncbi:probable 50S ribosomal protein L10 [Coccomyxa sp. Obi]|nr:probable 50S ribosomal protein L10 [Coccomyxa sp. Obi]